MLHAWLIGFPSTGKSTLFELMTSAKKATADARVHVGRALRDSSDGDIINCRRAA